MRTSNLEEFNPNRKDKEKILDNEAWVPCRICEEVFARVRLTVRYCDTCERVLCEGEHGSFVGRGAAVCVRCYNKASSVLK